MGSPTSRIRGIFRFLRRDALALVYAMRDPHAPLQAKLVAVLAIFYALSPIDLLPDFLPALGLLDDLLLVPLGMALAFRMMPQAVIASARDKASMHFSTLKKLGILLLFGVLSWILAVAVAWYAK